MIVLVCGGRAYNDRERVYTELDELERSGLILVCGYDPDDKRFQGADQLAYEWAYDRLVPVAPFPARWDIFGRAAGPRRNRRMALCMRPDVVWAFPGNHGTASMCSIAEVIGIEVRRIGEPA